VTFDLPQGPLGTLVYVLLLFQDTAQANNVSAMPTFLFFKNKVKIDSLRGADPAALEEKIARWYGQEGEEEGEEVAVKGHVRLPSIYGAIFRLCAIFRSCFILRFCAIFRSCVIIK